MRYAVESWAPEYGIPAGPELTEQAAAPTDCDIEVAADRWAPITPQSRPASRVLFVDGVRRIDARIWVTTDTGDVHAGIAASYAAGVVCCDGTAQLDAAESRRVVVSPAADAAPIETRGGTYLPILSDGDAAEDLVAALQQQMRALERLTTASLGPADLVVVDGPLSRPAVAAAIGYVKTHQRTYLSGHPATVVAALSAGQRTPLFRTLTREPRYAWYARLPGGQGHPWAGIVRGETPGDLSVADARHRADTATVTLPRFATPAHKDPRAPQNLHPIAELERALRRRLGDPAFAYRSLRMAAAATASA